jgi:hypothetical protein
MVKIYCAKQSNFSVESGRGKRHFNYNERTAVFLIPEITPYVSIGNSKPLIFNISLNSIRKWHRRKVMQRAWQMGRAGCILNKIRSDPFIWLERYSVDFQFNFG